MKTWLVDTNVLLDVIGSDPIFGQASSKTVAAGAETGMLVINPVISSGPATATSGATCWMGSAATGCARAWKPATGRWAGAFPWNRR